MTKPLRMVRGSERARRFILRALALGMSPALLATVSCGGGLMGANQANATFSISSGVTVIDTNCTGCNTTTAHGASVQQFTVTRAGSGAVAVTWSVSGGDAISGPGSMNARGQYTPPSYLTADRVEVVVTAALKDDPSLRASTVVTVTPGFLQPLTPENAAVGANGRVSITGILAEAGGATGINFSLAGSSAGGGQGSLGATHCQRSKQAFTSCTVTYTAPAFVSFTGTTYVVATVGNSSSRNTTALLVNAAGINSNPATHQAHSPASILLGSSAGNNTDYDTQGNQVADCCSGTLGALLTDSSKRRYLLSNNHVLAKSDRANVGDAIIHPGLIDNNCTPLGAGGGAEPVATLTDWLPLRSRSTNVDAAIAQVNSRAVDAAGRILELGVRQADGRLAAAPPGISSTGGRGESARLALKVAKSGRTTGLTCGRVTALDLDVKVNYYLDCGETRPYLTKTFTHQFGVSGNQFSDAGDSGALLVNAANAEPVGLFFAGGTDVSGVNQGVANPAATVLRELSEHVGNGTAYTFVGASDHAVSCLSYGDSTIASAQGRALSAASLALARQALVQARMLVNSATGILGVEIGKSSDHPGEAAIILYTNENMTVNAPATVEGVRTLVIPTTARAITYGLVLRTPLDAVAVSLSYSTLAQAMAVKNQVAAGLMRRNPAFFGVGVGQSLDNPREAALVIYVDRNRLPAHLPATINGLRTRYIVMERLHVTRSYAIPSKSRIHCMPHRSMDQPARFDPLDLFRRRSLPLN
jgi:hypothetical protein